MRKYKSLLTLTPFILYQKTNDSMSQYGRGYSLSDGAYKKIVLGSHLGAGIDSHGNLIQINPSESKILLKGFHVLDVSCTSDAVYCITSGKKIVRLSKELKEIPIEWSIWNLFYKPRLPICKVIGLHWNESPTMIQSGVKDTFVLTSKGRVFKSQTKEDEFELVKMDPVAQIACGYTHTLFRLKNGRVFGMGSNLYGQLSSSCKTTEDLMEPKEIQTLWNQLNEIQKPEDAVCSNIAAGDGFSLFVVDRPSSTQVLSCGTGINGQLGHGGYNHVQILPVKVKNVSDLTEWNESLKQIVPIRISKLMAGASHAAAVLDNAVQTLNGSRKEMSGKDILVWGNNSLGQLFNASGKKVNIAIRPTSNVQDENSRIQLFQNEQLVLGSNSTFLYHTK